MKSSEATFHVMLVEDSISQATKMTHLLESAGWKVTWTSNAESAFEKLLETDPDLVLLDYYLPGMRGDEVCRRIRRNIHSRNLPVVMLTMEESNTAELRGLDSGADDFIPKSEDPDVLILRLRTLLGKARSQREILAPSMSSFRSARLLAIDDSSTFLERLRPELEREGYEVITSSDPHAGFERVRDEQFDAVLIDLVMPGLDGLELCRRVDRLRNSMEAPLVMVVLTGDDTRESYTKALQAGADDFVVKSHDFAVLKGRIRALLRRKFFEEENRKIADELRQKEMEAVQARIEKEAAQARAKLVEQLERVADELRRSQADLQQANQAKDQFLAILSHELRTPLTPVLATIGIWQNDSRLPAELLQDLAMLRRNVELEARLIDDLLDLTKIARNKLELRIATVDMKSLLEQAIEICRAPDSKGPELINEFQATEHHVSGDSSRLTQVLWNLLRNAIKFTPEDGQIVIRSRNESLGSERQLCIEVSDNGVGIVPEALPYIFNAFEQGGRSVTQQFGGLGLGLAISKAIAELHGGSIRAASDGVGKGATFTVILPIVAIQPGAPDPAGEKPAAGTVRAPSERLRLLLVEDHEDTLASLSRLMTRRGYVVTTASSVAAAREQLSSGHCFDLMVSDLGLPDGSGCDILPSIAEEFRVPAIALSGFGLENDVKASQQAGFVTHLTKPVDFSELDAAIQALAYRAR